MSSPRSQLSKTPPRGRRLCALLLAVAGTGALAYTFGSARWLEPRTIFHSGISGTAPSGTGWATALEAAMAQWNDSTVFTFETDRAYVDPCAGLSRSDGGSGFPVGNGDGRNSAGFHTTVCGNSFGTGSLAITLSHYDTGALGFMELVQTDIVFNANVLWDVYEGPRQSRFDFGRVALHELGHALGLDHEAVQPAIMARTITNLYSLQADDIAGVNALYSGSGACVVRTLAPGAVYNNSLNASDCRVLDLFSSSQDTSFVDVYRLELAKETDLDILMHSGELDAVLILTDANLGGIEIHDDSDGQCDAHIRKRLPAGEYRILANTYDNPVKCAGNTGNYSLTISDSGLPLLGAVRNAGGGGTVASAVITGGATANAGANFATLFSPNQPIDVLASIVPDPAHVGLPGRLYVLAVLGDGRRFMKDATGRFVPLTGGLANLLPYRSGTLAATEAIAVATGLRGDTSGLAGSTISVYVGYALDSAPEQIWYGSTPLRLTLTP